MTPDEVRAVRFHRAKMFKRGIDEQDVDGLLDRIEAALRTGAQVAADELTTARMRKPPVGKRGYDKPEVDAFLARARVELTREN